MNITIVPIPDPSQFFDTQWQWNQAVSQYNHRLIANQQITSTCGIVLPEPCFDSILKQMNSVSERYIRLHQRSVAERLEHDICFWMEETLGNREEMLLPSDDKCRQEMLVYNEMTLKALRVLATLLTKFGVHVALRCVVDLRTRYGVLFPIDLNSDEYSDVLLEETATDDGVTEKPWLLLDV